MKKDAEIRLRASQFTLGQLTLVDWLLAAPEGSRRFVVTGKKTLKFFETGERRPDGKLVVTRILGDGNSRETNTLEVEFGGKIKVDPFALVPHGLLAVFNTRYPNMAKDETSFADKVADIFIEGSWGIEGRYYEIGGDWVRDWYCEFGAARREKLLTASRAKSAGVRRRAVFGRPWRIEPRLSEEFSKLLPDGYRLDLPNSTVLRPCVVATITAETDKRFKVTEIKSINGNWKNWLGLTIGKDEYFEREYLILDNAVEADIAALAAFDEEYVREIQAISDEIVAEIVPVIARMGDRLKQKQGQHKDMLSDLVAKLASSKLG